MGNFKNMGIGSAKFFKNMGILSAIKLKNMGIGSAKKFKNLKSISIIRCCKNKINIG